MEPLGIVIVILWLIAGFFNAAKKRGQPPTTKRPRPRPPPPTSGPGTQRRGGILDHLRAELERIQREAELSEGRVPRPRLPEADGGQEPESIEVAPVVVSREDPVERGYQPAVSLDGQAEVEAARRVREAQARNRALTLADHKAFDERIRARPRAVPTPAASGHPLRRAIVWREILGPPVALRDRER